MKFVISERWTGSLVTSCTSGKYILLYFLPLYILSIPVLVQEIWTISKNVFQISSIMVKHNIFSFYYTLGIYCNLALLQ